MKALYLTKYGKQPKWEFRDCHQPSPGPGQVLVKVAATSVNPLDLMIAHGELKALLPYKLPHVLGHDVAGTVAQVGSEVTEFSIGDEVFARPSDPINGCFAEYVVVDAHDAALKPTSLSMVEAAALPLVLLTSIQAFLEKSEVAPGSSVFVQGGTGGLGSIAIQVAKLLGARVATTVSTPNVERARQLGADVVIDYRTQNYEEILSDVDVVLDTIGGSESVRAMKVLKTGGVVVSVAGAPDRFVAKQFGKPFLGPVLHMLSRKERAAAKKLGVNYRFLFMTANGQQLRDFTPAIENGDIKPVVGEVLTFDQLPSALADFSTRRSIPGKVVVRVEE